MNRTYFSTYIHPESGSLARADFDIESVRELITCDHLPDDWLSLDLTKSQSVRNLKRWSTDESSAIAEGFQRLFSFASGDADSNLVLREKIVLEVSPLYLASLHLIQFICGNWNNESLYAMAVLQVHAQDVGCGQPNVGRIAGFQRQLEELNLSDVLSGLQSASADIRISDGAFNLPAKLVLLGHFPESMAGEILGINLALRQWDESHPMYWMAKFVSKVTWPLDLRSSRYDRDECLHNSVKAIEEYAKHDKDSLARVLKGYAWATQQLQIFSEQLLEVLDAWLDPREPARQMIANRKVDACQYHKKTKLAKVPMQSLLNEDDSENFLNHLARSAFVKEGLPEKSPLLNKLISPSGKMFRIFSQNDIRILNTWISGLPFETDYLNPPAYKRWADDGELNRLKINAENLVTFNAVGSSSIRNRYHRLLRNELSAGDETWARDYVEKWLSHARRDVAGNESPLPKHWSIGALQPWLQERHELSNQQFEQEFELPSKEAVVADILSLAPLTMIDGAWLSGFSHTQMATSSYGYRLFETFFDELGNGVECQNHPIIYRELLNEVYGEFPMTSSIEFAEHTAFSEENFELPVYWLSIGRYPMTYAPEILGLNLAMELSGVGGGYRRTHQALIKYRFSTLFVDLHNTIDNISTGHTAWAAAAIDAYLSGFSVKDQKELWERIRCGFASLNPTRRTSFFQKIKERMRSII